MQLELAVKMRGQGKSAKEIYEEINALKERMRFIAQIADLKYLRMGGRLSVTKALIATTMKIYPLGTLYHGVISIMATVRGEKKSLKWMVEYLKNTELDKQYGIHLGHSDNPEKMEKLKGLLEKEDFAITPGLTESIGPTIGTHVGPDLVGIVFVEKEAVDEQRY
jgi:DegV family protein with EDD domain